MVTILAVYNSSRCIGRCDSNCYNAKKLACTCICGSRNHGKGYTCAVENTSKQIGLLPDDLIAFAAATRRDPKTLTVINRLRTRNARAARKQARWKLQQLDLFDREEIVI